MAYRFFPVGADMENSTGDEFDESDVWGLPVEPEFGNTAQAKSANRKRWDAEKVDRDRVNASSASAAASLPVKIPDWAKILKDEYNGSYCRHMDDVDEDEEVPVSGGVVIPPHEFLCRNRAASFSVHEGIGRTLKGRDLSRVRNAIFAITGFQD